MLICEADLGMETLKITSLLLVWVSAKLWVRDVFSKV